MLTKFGLKEIRRNLLLYSLTIVLLTVIFVILTFAITVTVKSTQKYFAIRKIMDSEDGYCLKTQELVNPDNYVFIKNKKELQEIVGANLHAAGQYRITGALVNGELADVWSYDRELLNAYTPNIIEGRWFKEKDYAQGNKLYGVAVSDGSIQVGDTVEVMDWTEESAIDVEIIGLIKDSSSVMGNDAFREVAHDYTDFYYTYSTEGEEKSLLILSNDQLDLCDNVESMETEEPSAIARQQYGILFLTWETEEDRYKVDDFISVAGLGMPIIRESVGEIQIGSEKAIKAQLYNILPVVVCSLILVLLVTISVGTVSVKQQLHNYAIYSLCGLDRERCVFISMTASLCCVVLAFIVSHVGMLFAGWKGWLEDTAVEISLYTVGGCMVIWIIYIGISMLIPGFIIRNKTIKTLLITHRE